MSDSIIINNEGKKIDLKYYNYVWNTFIIDKYIDKIYNVFSEYFNVSNDKIKYMIMPYFKFNMRLFVNHLHENNENNKDFNYFCKGSINLIKWDVLTGINKFDENDRSNYFGDKLYFKLYRYDTDEMLQSIKISKNYLCHNYLTYYKIPTNIETDYCDNIKIDEMILFLNDIKKFIDYMKINLILPLNKMWRRDLDIYLLSKEIKKENDENA